MHQRSLMYKSQVLPQLNDEIRDQNILLAFAQQRANRHAESCQTLERAMRIQMAHNGEYNYKTAQVLCQLGDAQTNCSLADEAIQHYEQACMILTKLEGEEAKPSGRAKEQLEASELSKVHLKLDKVHLKLIDLYLDTQQALQCKQIISLVERRLDSISTSQEYAYRLMNELANSLHQHQEYDQALIYYKKALLCMKRRHKNKYIAQPETAKILINIATVHFVVRDLAESLKYYQHALEVLYRVEVDSEDNIAERGKVHMSLASLNR
jgi:tetratricopeptide (TPR) repeat protein